MIVGIENDPRDYAWGSVTAIPELLGREPTGRPAAEVWYGTHPGCPSRVAGGGSLADVVPPLPFLLKLIAPARTLSIQVHPDADRARAGFERENAAGIPVGAPHRNYRDPHPKPELVMAVSDRFRALGGLRAPAATLALLEAAPDARIGPLRERLASGDLRGTVGWLLSGDPQVADVVAGLVAAAADAEGPMWEVVRGAGRDLPGDPGIAVAALAEVVDLARGEVLYLPPGGIHAYQEGLGVELMGPSDNVLRGGLTEKHVDVAEFLAVADFEPGPAPRIAPRPDGSGAAYVPEGSGLALRVRSGAVDEVLDLDGPAIALVVRGAFRVGGRDLRPGGAVCAVEERSLPVTGAGDLVVAHTA